MRGSGRQAATGAGPRANIGALWPYLREHRGILAVVIALNLVSAAAQLGQPVLVSRVIGDVQSGAPIDGWVFAIIGLVVSGALIATLQHYLLQRTGAAIVLSARRKLAMKLLGLPIRDYDIRRTGDLVSRVGSDTTLLYAVVTQGLVNIVGGAAVLIGAVIAMLVIDPVLFAATGAVLALAIVAVTSVSGGMRRASREQQERVGDIASAVERALSAIRTVRAARAEQREAEAIIGDAQAAYRAGLKVARLSAIVVPVASLAMQLSLLVVLGLGGLRVAAGALSIANLIAFIIFLFLIVGPLGQAFGAVSSVNQALGALGRINEVLDLPSERDSDAELAAGLATEQGPGTDGRVDAEAHIVFEAVSFGYEAERPVLNEVTFTVQRGQRLALVGPSGAGKSTILALIERFYDPASGTIRLDGVDLRRIDRDALRAQIGYVEQDAPVLAGSIRQNLLLGAPQATDADLIEVLDRVNLADLVARNPLGLDAPVGEDGVMLSGGERQRLAIARALLQAAPILLLDESTSSLDGVNEGLMRAAIDAVADNRTLVVIAHRLATVVDSDLIVVLDKGRVIGTGTHAELLESTPLYRELAEHQLLAQTE